MPSTLRNMKNLASSQKDFDMSSCWIGIFYAFADFCNEGLDDYSGTFDELLAASTSLALEIVGDLPG